MDTPTLYANPNMSTMLQEYQDSSIPDTQGTAHPKNSLLSAGIGAGVAGLAGNDMLGTKAVADRTAKVLGAAERHATNDIPEMKKILKSHLWTNKDAFRTVDVIKNPRTLMDHIKRMSIVNPNKLPDYLDSKSKLMDRLARRDTFVKKNLSGKNLKNVRSKALTKLLSTWEGKGKAGAVLAGGAGLGYLANKLLRRNGKQDGNGPQQLGTLQGNY